MFEQKSLKLNMIINALKGLMSIVFPLITFPYVSKVLGVDNVGKYNFSVSVISYFVLIAGLGIGTYAVREGARFREENDRFNEFAKEIFSINIIATIISYVLFFTLLFSVKKFTDYRDLLLILSLQVGFIGLGVEWVYSIFEDYAYITIRSFVFQLISLLLLFICVKTENDVCVYAVITVISSVGSNIFNFYHARKYCTIRFTKSVNLKKHMKPILVLFAMSVMVTIYVSSDLTILGFLCDDYSVGIYSVSVKVYSIIKTVLSSVLVVSISRLSALLGKNEIEQFNKVASDIYSTLLTVVFPAITGIIVLRRNIILILSDESYISASSSLVLLSIALFFCLGAWFWGQCILVPIKKENVVFFTTLVSATVNIVLNFILIPYWKENAAAFTTIISQIIAFVCCWYSGRKYAKTNGSLITLLKVLVGCMGIVIVSIFCKLIIKNDAFYVIVTVLCSVAVYFLIEILLKNESVWNLTDALKNRIARVRN